MDQKVEFKPWTVQEITPLFDQLEVGEHLYFYCDHGGDSIASSASIGEAMSMFTAHKSVICPRCKRPMRLIKRWTEQEEIEHV